MTKTMVIKLCPAEIWGTTGNYQWLCKYITFTIKIVNTQTQVDKWCGRRPKETRCETVEKKNIGKRGMDINYKGSQGQTERAV